MSLKNPLPAADDDREALVPAFSASEETEARFVHPSAKSFFDRYPWSRRIPIFNMTCEGFGPMCTFCFGGLCLFYSGVAGGLWSVTNVMLKDYYGVDATRIQRLQNIGGMGVSVQPFLASMCDSFSFFGYTRRWYLCIFCITAAALTIPYALLPPQQSSANIACIFIFFIGLFHSGTFLLIRSLAYRLMRNHAVHSSSFVIWKSWCGSIGDSISTLIVGPLADKKLPNICLWMSIPLQFLSSTIFFFNWLGENTNRVDRAEDMKKLCAAAFRQLEQANPTAKGSLDKLNSSDKYNTQQGNNISCSTNEDAGVVELQSTQLSIDKSAVLESLLSDPVVCGCGIFEFNKEVIQRNKRIFICTLVMAFVGLTNTFARIYADTFCLLIVTLITSLVCMALAFWALPLLLAKLAIYNFLGSATSVSLGGPMVTFFLADSECLPDGPHFTWTFVCYAGLISVVFQLAGLSLFNAFLRNKSFRFIFVLTTIFAFIMSIFDLCMINRWTTVMGIPDYMMYIGGDCMIAAFVSMMAAIPATVLSAHTCPRGTEGLVSSLMTVFRVLGGVVSASIGSIFIEYIWPVKSTVPCDFSNLPKLNLICQWIIPLLILPLTFILIPDAKMTEELNPEGHGISKQVAELAKRLEPFHEKDKCGTPRPSGVVAQ